VENLDGWLTTVVARVCLNTLRSRERRREQPLDVHAVAGQALTARRLSPFVRPALVNGAAGVVVAAQGRPLFVMAFTVREGKIVAIDVLSDPERLHGLDLTVLDS
jgi:RNA polymerase sigma-70 factor (ECF subfamily)